MRLFQTAKAPMSLNRVITKKQKGKSSSPEEQSNGKKFQIEPHQSHQQVDSGKEYKLREKKIAKFQERIDRCYKCILGSQIQEAIGILKEIIQQNQFSDRHQFRGVGIDDEWVGKCPKGPIQWFSKPQMHSYISRNPFDLLSICFMIEIINKTIKLEQVIQTYDHFSLSLGQTFEVLMGKGNAYYNAEYYLKADGCYQKALEIKQSQKLYQYLGWLHGIVFDRNDKGTEYCQKCLSINSNNLGARYVKIQCIDDQDKMVIEMGNKLVDEYPEYYRVLVFIGNVEEDSEERVKYYERALEKDPDYLIASIQKSLTLSDIDSEESRKIMADLMARHPNHAKVQWGMGQLEMEMQNPYEAAQHFKKAIELNPRGFSSMKDLAYLYRMDSDTKIAITWYEKYIELNPFDKEIYNYLGLAYDDTDKKEEGMKCYLKALELDPKYFQSLSNLGLSYQQDQKFDDALIYYKKALEVNPENGGIAYGIAIAYQGLKKYKEAQQWAQKCIDLGADEDKEVYQFLGDLHFAQSHYKQSLEWYLVHVDKVKELNTEYILENCVNSVDKFIISEILVQIASKMGKNSDKIFSLVQIWSLFVALKKYQEAAKIEQIVELIKKRNGCYLHRRIQGEIRKMFGDKERGVYRLKQHIELQKLKDNFDKLFRGFLGFEQMNLEVEVRVEMEMEI